MIRAGTYGLLVVAASASAPNNDALFQQFMSTFDRVYATPAERVMRRNAFDANMAMAAKLQKSNPSATYGHLSPFADKVDGELDALFRPLRMDNIQDFEENLTISFSGGPPSSYDSLEKGYVTGVKDQSEPSGHCDSCWSFVTATLLETGAARQHAAKLQSLSMQQLLDCDHRDDGCGGGNFNTALNWMEEMSYGLEKLADYPYTAKKGKCQADRKKMIVKPGRHFRLKADDMAGACYEFGALGVGLNSKPITLNTGGLIDLSHAECDPKRQIHAVTIIGYGLNGGTPYWHFKNTWGTIWGNKGYGMIRRGKNTCGIETFVIGAKIEQPRSEEVVV